MVFHTTKEIEFDAGHRVPFHDSACRFLHGHRYRVRATVAGDLREPDPGEPRSGMVLDFSEIKRALVTQVHDPFDHTLILWQEDPLLDELLNILQAAGIQERVQIIPCTPTAEELARLFFHRVDHYLRTTIPLVNEGFVHLESIEVWETPTSMASYHGDDR